jgi:hypothetical protein
MSEAGGIIREMKKVEKATSEAVAMLSQLPGKIGASSVSELADSFLLLDHCLTHLMYLEAIKYYISREGRSRGSYIIVGHESYKETGASESMVIPDLCTYDREVEKKILVAGLKDGIISINPEDVREIPEQNLWFEKVWKDFLEDIYMDY